MAHLKQSEADRWDDVFCEGIETGTGRRCRCPFCPDHQLENEGCRGCEVDDCEAMIGYGDWNDPYWSSGFNLPNGSLLWILEWRDVDWRSVLNARSLDLLDCYDFNGDDLYDFFGKHPDIYVFDHAAYGVSRLYIFSDPEKHRALKMEFRRLARMLTAKSFEDRMLR
jgi:hypothetical protein